MIYAISSGNASSGIVVDASQPLLIYSGGTANNTTVNYWGRLTVSSGGVANSTTVNSDGSMWISSGGIANSTTVNSHGYLCVSGGGTANNTTVNFGGSASVDGGVANNVTVYEIGVFGVYNAGTANDVTVNSGGRFHVMSGATANRIKENGGNVGVEEGAIVTFLPNVISGIVFSNASPTIHSGTTATNTTVNEFGKLLVFSGGTANNTTVNSSGYLHVSSGGVANSTTVNSRGCLYVFSGGTANDTTVNSGYLYIFSKGQADNTTFNSGGTMFVSSGGSVNNTIVNSYGYLCVSGGGTANNTTVNSNGSMFVSAVQQGIDWWGGLANSTTVNGGKLEIRGGTISDTTVNSTGSMCIYSGGTAENTLLSSGGNLTVYSGGKMTGRMTFENGVIVSAYDGSILDFNLIGGIIGDTALVNDLSIVHGTPKYTLTISEAMSNGKYKLAEGVRSFNKTISVVNSFGTQIGKLSVGSASIINGREYELILSGKTLAFTIDAAMTVDDVMPTVFNVKANTQAPTNQDVIVMADFADDVELAQSLYRIGESGTWTAYPKGGVTVTANTTVYFKAVDTAGNESDPVSITISNIDKVAPTITGITPNTMIPAASVTVTAIFADDVGLASKQYKIGDGEWKDYTGGVMVTTNTMVYFKAIDTAGNEAEDSYVVSNIETTIPDTTPPIVANVQASITAPTNQNVTVTAMFSDDVALASQQYKIGAGAWLNYTTGVTISENSTIYFKAIDTSGNESEVVSYEVTNIDKVKPEKPTASADITDATDTEVKVSAVFSDDSIVREYSHDNETWTAYTVAVVFTENGVVYFRGMDAAGNISEVASYTVSNITGRASVTSSGVVLYSRQKAVVQANEIYEDTTVSSGGSMLINPEGVANGITLDYGGYLSISSGGVVKGINANSGCKVYVSAGGTATEITENGGYVEVTNGATVSFLPNSFSDVSVLIYISIHSGTIANNTNLTGSMFVYSGGVANNTSNGGTMSVSSGAVVNNTICKNRGQLNLYGGTANNTTVNTNGMFNINPGGAADGITVSSGGWLSVYNGKITGKMTFEEGAHISAMEKTILDFDISELESGSGALVNNLSLVQGTPNYTLTVSDTQAVGTYKLAEGAGSFDTTISVVNTAGESFGTFAVGGTVKVGDADCTLKLIDSVLSVTVSGNTAPIDNLVGTPDKVSWEVTAPGEEQQFIVEYSTDNFAHVIRLAVDSNSLDSFQMPAGNYQWRVKPEDGEDWIVGDPVTATADNVPKLVKSNKDGIADVFFANVVETWEAGYVAQHVGSINDWTGTNEYATVFGKNKLADIIEGSTDANILLLTDEDNGDTLFVDDIYTDLPGSVAEQQSRIAQIDEIRAGAGDDIVDMTSQRFEYIGDGLTIRGGEGNDTIWANKGDNFLFGDAGNDRIVGASGNDVIAGGIGNDRMHGGGGDDVFTFCDNWGADNVEQLAGGSVTLWFASELDGKVAWDEDSQSYTDGTNRVKVSGVTVDKVTLKFGDDGTDRYSELFSTGAFLDATSERIFEESGRGVLASL